MKENQTEVKDKSEELNKKGNNLFPSDKTYATFQNFFNSNKGIEALWKNVENNENKSKFKLYEAETKILGLVNGLTQQLDLCRESLGDRATNKQKDDYNEMVKLAYAGHEKEGKNFLKKFPNWSFNLSTIISTSNHYKRIANATDFKDANFKNDFKEDLNIKFNRKEKIKPTGLKGKAGSIFSSIGKFFKNFGKNFTGKASKSGVEKKVQAFFKRVNAPWRRWWEFICDGSQELSQKSAKQNLKKILDNNDDQNAKKAILKFFISPNGKTTKLSWEINDEVNNIGFVDDNDKFKINLMFRVFKSLDKKLGTRVEAKFNGEKGAKNIDTNDDKINELLKLYNTFKSGKVIKFKRVFELLGIGTNSGLIELTDQTLNNKVDNLFKDSNFSSDKTAKENVTSLAKDAKRFLEAYYKKDTKDKLLYELKFLGSTFGFSELNNVKDVNQAINVLNRAPSALIDILKINDPEVARKIDEEIAKSAENIKSLNGALKNLDKVDFNKPENQQTLLNALGAIEKNNLLQLGTSERFEDLTLNNFCNKLAFTNDGKYAKIAGSINDVFKDSKDKKINEFIKELKESLVKQEVKKNGEKKKQSEQNIQKIENLFKNIKSEEANYNGDKKALNNPDEGKKIITAIKKMIDYQGSKRTEFLKAVAKHIGINDENVVNVIAHTELSKLGQHKNDTAYLLLRKIRNLIAYGIGVKWYKKSTGESMPEDVQ